MGDTDGERAIDCRWNDSVVCDSAGGTGRSGRALSGGATGVNGDTDCSRVPFCTVMDDVSSVDTVFAGVARARAGTRSCTTFAVVGSTAVEYFLSDSTFAVEGRRGRAEDALPVTGDCCSLGGRLITY